MIARRFFVHFILAMAVAIATTIGFEFYALSRAAENSVEQHVVLAESAARFVGSTFESEASDSQKLLESAVWRGRDLREAGTLLREFRAQTLDRTGVAVFDTGRAILAHDLEPGSLPPPEVLLPVLRRAEKKGGIASTDLWWGTDGVPRAAIVVSHVNGGRWLAALRPIRLDGPDFLHIFRYFVVHERMRLHVLDSKGDVLFSTRPEERFTSAIHGTYFTDKVRLGEPVGMRCHSCHTDQSEEPVRVSEFTAVAPVPGLGWSVSVRDTADSVFAPIQEVAYSTVALVSIILGSFVTFYALLSWRVLRPITALVEVAKNVTAEENGEPPSIPRRPEDELALLMRSLDAARKGRTPSGRIPVVSPGDLAPSGASPPALQASVKRARILAAIERALEAVLPEIVRTRPCTSAIAIFGERVRASGLRMSPSGPDGATLAALAASGVWITPDQIRAAGASFEEIADTERFFAGQDVVLDSIPVQIWIGVGSEAQRMGLYLEPALQLISTHISHLLQRSVLLDELSEEHEQKNKLLRYLFRAEEEERRRIAREIHDEASQVLNALLIQLETFPAGAPPEKQAKHIERAKAMVERILEETDRLIFRLRPSVLDDLGLVQAVLSMAKKLLADSGINFELDLSGETDCELPEEVEATVYRVMQEAVTNVRKHAGAKSVFARIEIAPSVLHASIEDDGRGMAGPSKGEVPRTGGWGLLGMRERIIQLGGTIEFSTSRLGGARIVFEIPYQPTRETQ